MKKIHVPNEIPLFSDVICVKEGLVCTQSNQSVSPSSQFEQESRNCFLRVVLMLNFVKPA